MKLRKRLTYKAICRLKHRHACDLAKQRTVKESQFESYVFNLKLSSKFLSRAGQLKHFGLIAEECRYDSPIPYNNRRKFFDTYKDQWFKNWKWCWICKDASVQHIHHIVMLSHGGTNDESNLIGLCKNCHIGIHPWMQKELKIA